MLVYYPRSIFIENDHYSLTKMDTLGNVIHKYWDRSYIQATRNEPIWGERFNYDGDDRYLFEKYTHRIKIIDNSFEVKDHLSFTYKHMMPGELFTRSGREVNASIKEYNRVSGVIFKDCYVFVYGSSFGKIRKILYDHCTDYTKSVMFHIPLKPISSGFFDDLHGGTPFWPHGYIEEKPILWDNLDPYRYHIYWDNVDPIKYGFTYVEKLEKLKAMLDKYKSEDGNPMIRLVTLKNSK